MTAAGTSVDPIQADVPPVEVCAICSHAMSAHDRIAVRFCDATQTSALSRNCICRNV